MQWTRRLWEMTAETANGRRGFLGGGKGKVAGAEMARAYLFEGLVVDKAGSIFGHLELTFLDLLAKLHVAAWAPSGATGDLKKSRQGMSKEERWLLPVPCLEGR
jgi:hypothetical protein